MTHLVALLKVAKISQSHYRNANKKKMQFISRVWLAIKNYKISLQNLESAFQVYLYFIHPHPCQLVLTGISILFLNLNQTRSFYIENRTNWGKMFIFSLLKFLLRSCFCFSFSPPLFTLLLSIAIHLQS